MYRVTKPTALRRRGSEKGIPKQSSITGNASIAQDLHVPDIAAKFTTPPRPGSASASEWQTQGGTWTKGMRNVENMTRDPQAILRQFDLNPRYGPHKGLSRLARWQRAEKFGLNPPPELLQIMEDVAQKTLRTFDLNPRYGPHQGIDRFERWNRAKEFGLDPPEAIRVLIEESLTEPPLELKKLRAEKPCQQIPGTLSVKPGPEVHRH